MKNSGNLFTAAAHFELQNNLSGTYLPAYQKDLFSTASVDLAHGPLSFFVPFNCYEEIFQSMKSASMSIFLNNSISIKNDFYSASFFVGIMKRGIVECSNTLSATLPISIFSSHLRLWVPMTIISAFSFLAAAIIESAVSPSSKMV